MGFNSGFKGLTRTLLTKTLLSLTLSLPRALVSLTPLPLQAGSDPSHWQEVGCTWWGMVVAVLVVIIKLMYGM